MPLGSLGPIAGHPESKIAPLRRDMKFTVPVSCSTCGCDFKTLGYVDLTFPPATCLKCGETIHLIDPLTISIVAERLLYRSKAEFEGGDFTMPIICSAMAIETALTRLFLKWREIDHGFPATPTSQADRVAWEKEYRKGIGRGGFANSANFVSKRLTGELFDDFVDDFAKRSKTVTLIKAGFPAVPKSYLTAAHIHKELFDKRNRIMHWGEVNYKKPDAQKALDAGLTAMAVLRVMDKERADALERKLRGASQPVWSSRP